MGYLIRAIDEREMIKITAAITTDVVNEAAKIHHTSKTATAALGRTLTATAIMASWLKNDHDSLTVNIKGDGELGRIVCTGKNDGKVKGYVDNPLADAPVRQSDNKLDVAKIVGKGTMTVVMDIGMKEPYTGQVPLVSGEIAQDFANYFYTSDQIPSAVGLGVLVDVDYSVKAAGGFILQLMPGAQEEVIAQIEKNLSTFKNVTDYISQGESAQDLIGHLLVGSSFKILEQRDITYRCDCSREKVSDALLSVGPEELKAMLEEDGQAELNCYFCNEKYVFEEKDLQHLLEQAQELNSQKKK